MITPRELFDKLVYNPTDKFILLHVVEEVASIYSNRVLKFFIKELERLCNEYIEEGLHYKEAVEFDPDLLKWKIHPPKNGYKYYQILEEYGIHPEPECNRIEDEREFHKPFNYDFVIKNLKEMAEEADNKEILFDTDSDNFTAPGLHLPKELDTPKGRKYFSKAEELKFIEIADNKYNWKGYLKDLALFGDLLSENLRIENIWKILEPLFNKSSLSKYKQDGINLGWGKNEDKIRSIFA